MISTAVPTKVLVTVMTYPHPSLKRKECVCTAGVTEDGEWVRLYPVDYRYRPPHQRFRKYQWIEVSLHPRGSGNDDGRESRRPELDTISILGEPISTAHEWRERREIIDRMPHRTVKEWRVLYEEDKVSLGIVRPKRVLDLKIEPDNERWKPEWESLYSQMNLFGEQPKPLRKIPFKFSYVFECEDSHSPHNAMIEDWELGVLWMKEAERLGDERKAAESVRHKFLNELCDPKKDLRFFMGTTFPYNTWVVVGVFYPPRILQGSLF